MRRLLLALGLALAPAAAPASGPVGEADACATRVAARVQAHYEQVRDLKARFAQTTQSVTLGSSGAPPLEASGEVVFAKPGRMRWSYETPERSLVVTDGETLWIYDPEAREAQRMDVTGAFLSGAAIQFLLGQGDLQREFEISSADCQEGGEGDPPDVGLELLPRSPTHYERLSLRVDAASGRVHETTVVDLFGNRTRVRLRDVEVDLDPPAEAFRFEPPEGVRVIDLSAEHPTSQ